MDLWIRWRSARGAPGYRARLITRVYVNYRTGALLIRENSRGIVFYRHVYIVYHMNIRSTYRYICFPASRCDLCGAYPAGARPDKEDRRQNGFLACGTYHALTCASRVSMLPFRATCWLTHRARYYLTLYPAESRC